jgi:soluble lytic murein transglycosylase-like protein
MLLFRSRYDVCKLVKVSLFCLPPKSMVTRLFQCVAVCCGLLAGMARPAQAQIAIYVTENGKRVYVNAEPPVTRMSAPTKSTSKVSAASPVANSSATRVMQLTAEELDRIVQTTAEKHHVDPALVRAVIAAESGWRQDAISRKGAQGLMQLVPGTAGDLGVTNAFDPEQNVNGGVRYLRMLLERYRGDLDLALAAYNAGPGAVDRARGVPNYPETRAYVQKVTDTYFQPGSNRASKVVGASRPIYKIVDARGRVVYVNE